jgi:radical SAM superfamily enzyme YgiQ (UPF0313 family)
MKICFIQKNAMVNFGVMSIAGYLKPTEHNVSVLIDDLEPDLIRALRRAAPDIIGVSVVSSEHRWLIERCRQIKRALPHTPIIIGGVHAILYPEILSETAADLLCKSEGETVVKRVLDTLTDEGDLGALAEIPGLVFRAGLRRGAELVDTPMPPLLAEIAWEDDASIYYDTYPVLARDGMKQFISQRGCPYNCAFCFNSLIKTCFKGTGKYLRRKKPELFVNEIKWLVDRHGARFVCIYDDLFTSDRQWLTEFCAQYKERVGIKYLCQIRANHADEEIVAMLADSGCFTACVGLETGNEQLRRRVLNKQVSNEQLHHIGDLLRRHGINLKTGNMFGIPTETEEQAFETIELNIKIGTKFVGCGMLLPFPGTGIERVALEQGWLDAPLDYKKLPISAYDESIFNAPHIETLTNIMNVAQLTVFAPRLLPVMRRLVRLRCRPLFRLVHFSTLTLRFVHERNLGLFHGAAFLWRFRKNV